MPRGEHKATPKVIGTWFYHAEGAIAIGSEEWWQWLQLGRSFYFEAPEGTFTAGKERRKGKDNFWYAYRRSSMRLHKVYLGRTEDLTMDRLVEVARRLDAKVRDNA
jgi:LuxR family maltose regulon positive regulatory protein